MFRFTEIFAFASRISITPAGDDPMCISVEIHGRQDRRLWVDDPNRGRMDNEYRADFPTYRMEKIASPAELQADYKRLAVEAAQELFIRFGWDAPTKLLV